MIPIYCVTYKNPERRQKIKNRFDTVGLDFEFVESIDAYDPTIIPSQDILKQAIMISRWIPHAYSCMHGHFSAIEKFLQTGEEIGIVCEDDILLRRDFGEELPVIIANFKRQRLDILLLGYLTETDQPAKVIHNRPLKSPAFSYHTYDGEWGLWGTQMYMLSRRHAQMLYDNFGPHTDYKFNALIKNNIEFWIADCIITKIGNRALISPQIAVEEGVAGIPHQQPTHTNSYNLNYDQNIHI
jgi:GR25 family glycosyltransferase involved in LPS biosynthesis